MPISAKMTLIIPSRHVFTSRSEIEVPEGALFVYGRSEERSVVDTNWLSKFHLPNIFEVVHTDDISTAIVPKISSNPLSLRDRQSLNRWFMPYKDKILFLDITGLAHHVWMPLLRVALEENIVVQCIYTEPATYRLNKNPRPGEFYDLSEEIRGLYPIPTFSRLPSRRQQPSLLVASLGFEGVRFKYIVEKMEPNDQDLIPVVGVPGFEITYPFESFEGNASVLSSTRAWQRLEYVDASCPFAMLAKLELIHQKNPERGLQVATIGTKPHALGAMLFALKHSNCELLFDHPKKRQSRTAGSSRIHVYDLSGQRNLAIE